MATTTIRAIRATIVSLIKAIVPTFDTETPFKPYLNQGAAAFRRDMLAAPQASTRRYQVRARAGRRTQDATNTDVVAELVTFDIVIAYAQTHRWGADAALDRDDAIEEDLKQLEFTVGREGYANIPNASWLAPDADGSQTEPPRIERDDAAGVDFLVITQTMRFYRAR